MLGLDIALISVNIGAAEWWPGKVVQTPGWTVPRGPALTYVVHLGNGAIAMSA